MFLSSNTYATAATHWLPILITFHKRLRAGFTNTGQIAGLLNSSYF